MTNLAEMTFITNQNVIFKYKFSPPGQETYLRSKFPAWGLKNDRPYEVSLVP